MDSPTNNIQQLLSGMLDCALSEVEAHELKEAMAVDPTIQAQLDRMRVVRQSLNSGRSSQVLRPDFAANVMFAAKKRATAMGSEAPAWLNSPDSAESVQKTLAPSIESPAWRRWILAGGFSLAASVLILVFSFPNAKRPEIASTPQVSVPQVSEPELAEMARTGPGAVEPPVDLETKKPSASIPTELLAQSEIPPKAQPTEKTSNAPIDVLESVANSEKDKEVVSPSVTTQIPTLMMVVDFSIAPEALETKALEKILEKHNIAFEDDLVLDKAQLKILEESWMPTIAQGPKTEDKIGVMILKSRAENLQLAITEILNGIEPFPDCTLEMSTDKSVRQLVAQLSSIRVADSTSGVAKRLSFAGAQDDAPFTGLAVRGKRMSHTNRAKFASPHAAVLSKDKTKMSYALLFLRPVKK